jgi:nondiscriminating glutamyl-tRNA synthetase
MTAMVRTRFAPSPTGFLHVGGLRTALYNFFYARNQQGQLVLRIEDTDRTRFVEGAIENLIRTLHVMGIHYDEGPDKGGPYSPYLQSQRNELYQRYAQLLIEKGEAYYCFCTIERLEKMRKSQESAHQQPKYDGTCRNLSDVEIKQNLGKGIPRVIRLKMPQTGESKFDDLIRGEVTIQNELTDDQILIKSDGFPTYHLANVVDDHFMKITQVIRGEEWLLSVPKHLRLYQAFGWQPPQMAHLPLLLNPDRSKLSKRQGDVAVEDFLQKGYLPETLNNFIALLGWNPGTDQEFFTLEELITSFSLERVNKSGAVFDLQKLNWMNSHYLKQLSDEKRDQFLLPFLQAEGFDTSDQYKTKKIIEGLSKRISYGKEIVREAALFFENNLEIQEQEARVVLRKDTSLTVLNSFLTKAKNLPELTVDIFKNLMKEIQQETGIKKDELWMPIRVALTGVTHGPELPLVIEIFGKQKIVSFIQQALNLQQ